MEPPRLKKAAARSPGSFQVEPRVQEEHLLHLEGVLWRWRGPVEVERESEGHSGVTAGLFGVLQWIPGCMVAYFLVMWGFLEYSGGTVGGGGGCCHFHLDSEGHKGHQAGSRLVGSFGVSCLFSDASCRRPPCFRFLHRQLSASWVQILKPNRVRAVHSGWADGTLVASSLVGRRNQNRNPPKNQP